MKKTWLKRAAIAALWVAGFLAVVIAATPLVMPKLSCKHQYDTPETEIWSTFYAEERNTLDVFFVGSSHIHRDIVPAEFYRSTGLTSFLLSGAKQDMALSYWALKEGLRYHTPRYVLLDSYGLFRDASGQREMFKIGTGYMRFGGTKLEAVRDQVKTFPDEGFLARLAGIIDYHSRWEELTREDYFPEEQFTELNGYFPILNHGKKEQEPYRIEEIETPEARDPRMEMFFEKIVRLCEEKGIKLILINSPCKWPKERALAAQQIADAYEIPYLDFNTFELYEPIGLEDDTNWMDWGHLNTRGAIKYSRVLASTLMERGLIQRAEPSAQKQAIWAEKCERWDRYLENAGLKMEN